VLPQALGKLRDTGACLRRKTVAVARQPLRLHLGVTADVGCAAEIAQSPSDFPRSRPTQPRAVRPQGAAQTAHGHAKVVQRIGVAGVRKPAGRSQRSFDPAPDDAGRCRGS
jgi:hypothetical protein